jgi:tripartite-type tricarboxylate transporter receptor subunit TctC
MNSARRRQRSTEQQSDIEGPSVAWPPEATTEGVFLDVGRNGQKHCAGRLWLPRAPHRLLPSTPVQSSSGECRLRERPDWLTQNSINERKASSYRTLADLMNAARAKPGELTLAATGPATPAQMAFEMLKHAANVNMTFVPYPGGATVVTAVLGEHVTSALSDYPGAAEQLKAGKLRALAVTAETRIEALPDVPTVAEAGYKDSELDLWFGLAAPAKTPKQKISELAGWFTAAMQVPDVKAKLAIQGLYPVGMCGMDFARYLRKQYDEYGRIIREANIKP